MRQRTVMISTAYGAWARHSPLIDPHDGQRDRGDNRDHERHVDAPPNTPATLTFGLSGAQAVPSQYRCWDGFPGSGYQPPAGVGAFMPRSVERFVKDVC
jgi:hypothetical protein